MTSVDFPIDALLSILEVMDDGSTAEITTVGWEGFVEIDASLHHNVAMRTSRCLSAGDVVRVSLADFQRALANDKTFADSIYHAVRIRNFITEQLTACAIRHDANKRFARWLLLASRKQKRSDLEVTHEAAAGILGTRRATVTIAAQMLQASGAISYGRGTVRITDRELLKSLACSCYDVCCTALDAGL